MRKLLIWAFALCAPLLVVLAILLSNRPASDFDMEAVEQARPQGRLVVVVVDSLRAEALRDHMPHTQRPLKAPLLSRPVRTCRANFSLPCIRTLLEGRESPFSSSLHNFTGQRGASGSLPELAQRAGLDVVLISDVTLGSLYDAYATASYNLEKWTGDALERDQRAITTASEALDDPATDVVILHIVGTDKAAHKYRPGHPKYITQYEATDTALSPLFERLDPARDHLIVTGDHGHDDNGSHAMTSLVLLQGPDFEALPPETLPSELQQVDLLGLMALPMNLPLPDAFEGRLFGVAPLAPGAPEALQRFEATQFWALGEQGWEGASLADRQQVKNRALRLLPWLEMARLLPWLLLYLWYVLLLYARLQARATWREVVGVPALTVLVLAALRAGEPLLGAPVMAGMSLLLVTLATVLSLRRAGMLRLYGVGMALLVGAGLTSAAGIAWSDFLHSYLSGVYRGERLILFYVGWMACGAAIARVAWRRLLALPEALALAAFIVLPSGAYYYQFGQTILSGLIFGAAIVAAWRWRAVWAFLKGASHGERALAAAIPASAALTLWQRGASWNWLHVPWERLQDAPGLAWACLLASAGVLIGLGAHRKNYMLAMGACLLAALAYSVGFGQIPARDFFSALTPTLPVALVLALATRGHTLRPALTSSAPTQYGIWVGLALCGSAWFLCRGFVLDNVDMRFALKIFGGLARERDMAIGVFTLLLPKYGLVVLPALLLALLCARQHRVVIFGVTTLLIHLKILALLTQVLTGPLGSSTKLHEMAVMDAVFILPLLFISLGALFVAMKLWPAEHEESGEASA